MNYTVNGEILSSESSRIIDLINELKMPQSGIAIAVNNEVISKNDWREYMLQENDKILIITATQGG